MDVDEDDAFLYGEQSPPPATTPLPSDQPVAPAVAPAPPSQPVLSIPAITTTPVKQETPVPSGLSASMAASLAAYGIDPSAAVAAENPEDGGVEEEDPEDDDESDDDDDEDDVKLVFTGGAQRLDNRRPQAQSSNVIGIGKWAHTSTGQVAPAPIPPPVANRAIPITTANQTTEYTPSSRPTTTPAALNPLANPPIAPSGDGRTTPILQPEPLLQTQTSNALPTSSYPPVTAPATHLKIEPANPNGVIPSTGNSVYEMDLAQFEGSGQPWRKPGSDLSEWFNFGFDEVTYPKYLRYRQEMELGKNALANLPMGANMTPDVANLLHLQMPNMGMPGVPPQLQTMQQQMMASGMDPMMFMQNMQNMASMGGMPGMQAQMQQMQQNMGMQGMGMQGAGMPGGLRQPSVQRPSVTPQPSQQNAVTEPGEEVVKQEEGTESVDGSMTEAQAGMTGAIPGRGMAPGVRGGMPVRGVPLRGRGGAVPLGPRGAVSLPANIPKGPKAGRFKDKDRVEPAPTGLDYGDDRATSSSVSRGRSATPSRSRSPVKADRKPRRKERERSSSSYENDSPNVKDKDRDESRDRDGSEPRGTRKKTRRSKDKDRDEKREKSDDTEEKKREKRRREDGGGAILGPGGWESEEEEQKKNRRRRRSESYSEEEERHRTSRKRR